MRFLFATLQHIETTFYGEVALRLRERGHEVAVVTYSRRAAMNLERRGLTTYCLPMLMSADRAFDLDGEVARITDTYPTPTFRDIYRTDYVCNGRDETWCLRRTVRHVRAMERTFDEFTPDIVVPEVGNELLRTVAHLVGLARHAPVLFLFYTIFDAPLRLYIDQMHQPIVPPEEVRELSTAERAEVEDFITRFTRRRAPIREYRQAAVNTRRLRIWLRHVLVKLVWDRDNDYLRPFHMLAGQARERLRAAMARFFYRDLPKGPFVFFPLHVTDDYKIKRVIPQYADQASIIEQVARALPHGHQVVVKEHPMAIGRTPLSLLRRLTSLRNVRVVEPHTNTHEIIERAKAVVVISSTVGLEALLYGQGVLTLGDPFYAGYGVTIDAASAAEIRLKVPAVLEFQPDRERVLQLLHAAMRACYEGAPVLVDRSAENAARLARTLDYVAGQELQRRRGGMPRDVVPMPSAAQGRARASRR